MAGMKRLGSRFFWKERQSLVLPLRRRSRVPVANFGVSKRPARSLGGEHVRVVGVRNPCERTQHVRRHTDLTRQLFQVDAGLISRRGGGRNEGGGALTCKHLNLGDGVLGSGKGEGHVSQVWLSADHLCHGHTALGGSSRTYRRGPTWPWRLGNIELITLALVKDKNRWLQVLATLIYALPGLCA